jgi:hypothetical protein
MGSFSFDTNLIIALLNNKDRLHTTSLEILKKEKDNNCVFYKSAIIETAKVYRDKLNSAIVQLYPVLWEIQNIDDSFKKSEHLLQGIKTLIESNKNLENFYKILHEKIDSYIHKNDIKTLPHYLSNLVENITRTIDGTLANIIEHTVIFIDYDANGATKRLTDIKRVMASVRFKDSFDCDIFCELLMSLSVDFIICFYTDDDEFQKKGKRIYLLLQKELDFKDSWLKIIYTNTCT